MMIEGIPLSGAFQGATLATAIIAAFGALGYWIKGMAERGRVKNEGAVTMARIEENLRGEAAERFREFREEVHALRNELSVAIAQLRKSEATSMRRGDKLNMLSFILGLVMDALEHLDPKSKALAQARALLKRIEEEPHQIDNSDVLTKAEDTVDAANAAVREIKAEEAKR